MKKNVCFSGILVLALVFGLMFVGCDDPNGKPDTWTRVTDFSQLDGTWKGSVLFSISLKESMGMTDAEWENGPGQIFGNDMRVTMTMNITETFDSTAKTASVSGTITMTYSGSKVDAVWPMLAMGYDEVEGITIDDANHSITITMLSEPMVLTNDDISEALAAGILINQDGTKIRVSAEMTEEVGSMMGDSIPEIILIKQ